MVVDNCPLPHQCIRLYRLLECWKTEHRMADIAIQPKKPVRSARNIREVAVLFLRLGLTAFGGPAAHIAMMEDEVVRRRQWMSREEFLDLLGATNLIPGPNSTEMAIHIGDRKA